MKLHASKVLPIALLAAAAACNSAETVTPSATTAVTTATFEVPADFNFSVPRAGEIYVCKFGSTTADGEALAGRVFEFTFSATVPGTDDATPSVEMDKCVGVWRGTGPGEFTLQELPSVGTALDRYVVYQPGGVEPVTISNPADAKITFAFASGAIVFVKNKVVDVPPPPPPPTGGEGCTPGYWKVSQHFDSWPAPYSAVSPATTFASVFGRNTFGANATLLQVVSNGGGGVNALGRHSVAALLNAASSGVDYKYSVSAVIAGFQAAVDGGDVEGQKNLFEVENELGCPLN